MTIHVKKEGRVCTVYLDAAEQPIAITSADDQPVGGFPFTTNEGQLRGRYPGAQFIFHEPVRAPQPIAPDVPDELVAAYLKDALVKDPKKTQVTQQVQPPPQYNDAIVSQITRAFEHEVRETPLDAEVIGTFLINVFPELEPVLKEAAERVLKPASATKKAFRL